MDRQYKAKLFREIDDAWREVGYCHTMFKNVVNKGRANIDRVACRPRACITCECAVEWGIAPRLAERIAEVARR